MVAMIRLQVALGIFPAIEENNFAPDPIVVRTLACLKNTALDAIPSDTQSEEMQGNTELK